MGRLSYMSGWNHFMGKLCDFKECYPVQTAEYAVAQGIDHEPAFNWWARHTLKKRDHIISLVEEQKIK